MEASTPLLIYAFDAYCGWCYGFTPWLRRAVADRPHIAVEVVSGGLFTGSRRVPIRELRHIPTARHRVTAHTGAVFGPAFLTLLERGDFVMDSEDAAAGLAGLRDLAPTRALDLASAMSYAFYHDGHSLSDPDTYRTIAEHYELDGDAAAAALTNPAHQRQARLEFTQTRILGVQSYPTLLLDTGSGPRILEVTHTAPSRISEHLDSILAAIPF
ncbi:DsbA family protein [Nocardia altamirensis]|uniref:DsbA family protein n=1 Tax=Nocardia altamirensis TaxID=472158 RepID=UPI00084002D2|nr:DsbA family protein [Nocardia altamirensis]